MKKQLLILSLSLLGINTFGQVPNYVPTSGLVAFYTFSGNANDVSGNNFNGTVTGATLTTDRFGTANSAYSFVSGNQIVSNPNLPVGNSPRSISLWFQTSSTSYNATTGIGANVMMSYGSGTGTGGGVGSQLNCETHVGVLNLNHYATSLGGGTNYVSNGQWHHMLYTYNGALHQLYLDGNLIDSDTYALNTGLTSLFFGKRAAEPTWHQYNGKVDDAGIWNRALTLCEIQSLYSGTLPNIAVNAGVDQTICLGSNVTLEATGASSYLWDNAVDNGVAFTPSTTTIYTVSGTSAMGCTSTDQVVITVNALPLVNGGPDQELCQGQSTTLFGSGADTYSWNNGINNGVGFLPTATQEYVVVGTNTSNGCTNSDTVAVIVHSLPNVSAGSDLTICQGDTVILTGNGALNYTWNNNVIDGQEFVPASTQTYQVTGTDNNNCSNSDEVTITVNETSSSTLTEIALDSYTLNGQTYTQSGIYTQVIPNAAGCDSTITLNLTLNFTGLNELESTLTVAPNPTMDIVNITTTEAIYDEYVLFDPQGRKVLSGKLNGTTTQVDLTQLARGNYLLQIGEKKTPIKLIKQ